jgi:hypothetical protein
MAARTGTDPWTQRELLELLLPLLNRESERRPLVALALGEASPVLGRIVWSGAGEVFVLKLVDELLHSGEVEPGKRALWKLLEAVHERVGVERKARVDALEPIVNRPIVRTDAGGSAPRAGFLAGRPRPVARAASPVAGTSGSPPLHLRVFLASPGDVAEERALALQTLGQLPYEPLLRGEGPSRPSPGTSPGRVLPCSPG